MHRGWIKLYRCLLDDPVWQCSTPQQKVILVTLLLMANHTERKWQWQGQPYICRPGQFITSLASIQKKCGKEISIRKIQLALIRFEKMEFLSKQTSSVNTLLTICNWERYQSMEDTDVKADVKEALNDGQRRVKPVLTNKNVKNIKHEKKEPPFRPVPLSFEQQDIRQAQTANAHALAAFMEGDAHLGSTRE